MSRGTCTHPGCERSQRSRGLCRRHYAAWLHGDTTVTPTGKQREYYGPGGRCTFVGANGRCNRDRAYHGFCCAHAYRQKHGRPMDAPIKPRYKQSDTCNVPLCTLPVKCLGICNAHYRKRAVAKKAGLPDETWRRPIRMRLPNGVVEFCILKGPEPLRRNLEAYAQVRGMPRLDVAILEALREWWHEHGQYRVKRAGRLEAA